MKKFLYVVLPCVMALCFLFSINSPALSMNDHLFGRRLLQKHTIQESEPAAAQNLENLEIKQNLGGEDNDGDVEGLILNADYRDVTTHPSPLPKNPRP